MEFYKLIKSEEEAALKVERAETAVTLFYRMAEEYGGKPADYTCDIGRYENVQMAEAALRSAREELTKVRKQMKLHLLAILAE